MTRYPRSRTLERWLIHVRTVAVVYGAVAVAIQPAYPDEGTRNAAWGLVALLGIANLGIWGALGRVSDDGGMRTLAVVSYVVDVVVILGTVWVYAYEQPYVTWALLFLLPLEGALRYRLRGALGAAALVAVFFVFQSFHVGSIRGVGFDVPTYLFVAGLAGLIAAVAGLMAENWDLQSRALQEQSRRLAEVDLLKDRFLAVTTHEIRGPLTAIITAVDTIRRRRDRLTLQQQERLLEMTSSQAYQLNRLVEDLLLTAHIHGGSPTLRPEWVDLEQVVDQALEAAATKRRAHRLEVFIEPVQCEIDPSRTAQIVRNLVENAYKYTSEQTRVAVTARAVAGGVGLQVRDDGPGIAREKRAGLFEAFRRGDDTSVGQDGLGLGLYVVSQLVAAMGGHVDLFSSRDGTSFAITIPCATRLPHASALGAGGDEISR